MKHIFEDGLVQAPASFPALGSALQLQSSQAAKTKLWGPKI